MLRQQDQTQGGIEVTDDSIIDSISDSVINVTATSPSSSTARIPRVPKTLGDTDDYRKYYVPKIVSIGPYHYGELELQLTEKLKPHFAMALLSNKETLRSLYNKLGEPKMVQELRSLYEENSTTKFCNKEFTKMMLLDGCFVLYYIRFIYLKEPLDDDCPKLKSSQIKHAHQDIFLLENQIPYKVLTVVAKMTKINLEKEIESFIYLSSFVTPWWPKMKGLSIVTQKFEACDHLLHFLHRCLTKKAKAPRINWCAPSWKSETNEFFYQPAVWYNFRTASELVDVGIHFKPSDNIYLSSVEFSKGWLRFSANVKLPRIKVNDSTKHMLLNLIAYETCLCSVDDAWVASYVCLLDSLIDHPEDVKILRKAWVLENSLGSDKEVAKLFNEIATGLVPNDLAYLEAKNNIQRHYESWRNTLFSQLRNEYFRSPWAILALLGALIALFLSAVQSYFSVWSSKSECDDLCMLMKKNHHL